MRGFHLTARYVSIKLDTEALVQGPPCTAYPDLAEKPQEILASSADPDLMAYSPDLSSAIQLAVMGRH